ncbi:hypothetical protein TNCT_175291 [Trichonephila clavata]|uniref:Uncharacterized protein n=1 Tax=Trichonephila clavata TaxID=2740835 RepID=A0A8X6KIS0_TRICU|nr:hypothetical protein TNCT_175291 [Trichonephila clavata]
MPRRPAFPTYEVIENGNQWKPLSTFCLPQKATHNNHPLRLSCLIHDASPNTETKDEPSRVHPSQCQFPISNHGMEILCAIYLGPPEEEKIYDERVSYLNATVLPNLLSRLGYCLLRLYQMEKRTSSRRNGNAARINSHVTRENIL